MEDSALIFQFATRLKSLGYGTFRVFVIFVLMLMQVTAQGRPGERVTLSFKNGLLQDVLAEIRRQTGYLYALQDQWRTIARPVSISVKDMPVEQALNLCFKDQPFTYTIISKTIVIEARKPSNQKETIGAESTKPPDGISGVVQNEDGKPLSGATVELGGLILREKADDHGEFFFAKIPTGKYSLDVSFVGYERFHTIVNVGTDESKISITLRHFPGSLDQVQVIAYGTVTKRLNTGDVSTITATDIAKEPISNPILALEGRVPGILIRQISGLPGSARNVTIQVRGWNSLQNVGDPLYIVDGVPYASETLPSGSAGTIMEGTSGNPFNFLNPADIESIEVLKDADATAIYGSRGANGVVLITTKKGKEGNARIDLTLKQGLGQVSHFLNLLNTPQYLEMRREALKNDGVTPNPSADYDLTFWDPNRQTNWQKMLMGKTAQYSDGQTSISGGNSNTQFLMGASFHRETTVFPGDWNDQKASVHLTINNNSFENRLKMSLGASYVIDNNLLGQTDLSAIALSLPPNAPPLYNTDGTINWAAGPSGASTWPLGENPVAGLLDRLSANTHNLIGNGSISYDLFPGFTLKTTLGYTYMQNTVTANVPFASLDPATWSSHQRFSTFTHNHIQTAIVEPQITYKKVIRKATIDALLGSTIQENRSNGQVLYAQGFNSDLLLNDILAATTVTPLSVTDIIYRYNALFSRLNINWSDKYIVNLNGRRDGSSRFGPANRFANFYSVAGAWIFTKESWAQRWAKTLSFGKIRASYGTTGNDHVGDYTYLDLYSTIPNVGVSYQGSIGLRPTTIYTPNLQWELTRKLEAAIEIGLWHNRVLTKGIVYRNRSTNELVPYPLATITGFTSVKENLPAMVQNKGWEAELTTINVSGKTFRWSTTFNISSNKNLVAKITPGMGAFYQMLLGHPINTAFLYNFAGVNPITGLYQFKDAHGGLTGNPSPATDRTVAISLDPLYYGGLDNHFTLKTFELDILFQFQRQKSVGYPYYNLPGSVYQNEPATVLTRWRNPGDVSIIQKFGQNTLTANSLAYAQGSDANYQDASFIRIKNVSLSYTLPDAFLKRLHFRTAKFFILGENLFTFTKFQGLDPELLTYAALPPLRVVTGGLSLSF